MKHLAGILITEDQHRALVLECAGDAQFPKTWAQWEALLQQAEAAAAQDGYVPKPVKIDVGRFMAWVQRAGFVPCLDALRAYAIATRSPGEMGSAPVSQEN